MIPIIKTNLRLRRSFMFWWCVGIVAYVVLGLAFYPSLRSQAEQLNQSLQHIPSTVKALFSDSGSFITPQGYLSGRIFYLFLPMLFTIAAVNLGYNLIGKEERDKTIELLLSRPISRGRLLAAKALSGLIIMLAIGIISMISIVVMCDLVKLSVPLPNVAYATLLALLFSISIGALSFMLVALGRGARSLSLGLPIALALGSYLITSLISIASWLRWPARFTPFYFYRPADVFNGVYDHRFALPFIFGILVAAIVSYLGFRRRDLG